MPPDWLLHQRLCSFAYGALQVWILLLLLLILLHTLGYSRPIFVDLAQWQHLMMTFSLFCLKIQNLAQNRPKPHWGSSRYRKTLKLAPQNSPKYAILRSQNKKIAPSQTLPKKGRGCSWWGGEHPFPTTSPFGASSPPTLNSRWRQWTQFTLV